MNYDRISYELTRYLYRLGCVSAEHSWSYYEGGTLVKSHSVDPNRDSYPCPTVMEAVNFMWENRIARIYIRETESGDLRPEMKIPGKSGRSEKIYRPSIEFKTPGEVYCHCLGIFTDSMITGKYEII